MAKKSWYDAFKWPRLTARWSFQRDLDNRKRVAPEQGQKDRYLSGVLEIRIKENKELVGGLRCPDMSQLSVMCLVEVTLLPCLS